MEFVILEKICALSSGVERRSPKPDVVGSIPTERVKNFCFITI